MDTEAQTDFISMAERKVGKDQNLEKPQNPDGKELEKESNLTKFAMH